MIAIEQPPRLPSTIEREPLRLYSKIAWQPPDITGSDLQMGRFCFSSPFNLSARHFAGKNQKNRIQSCARSHLRHTFGGKESSTLSQKPWPHSPVIYEINTWVWLHDLTAKYGRQITLANVPDAEWDAIAALHADAVWFMGVWERSPEGRRIAREHEGLLQEYRKVLSDWTVEDTVGSPYCIHRYEVDEHLGGRKGLATTRGALLARGVRLILDYVPNHVAPDHPWVKEHPVYFIQGNGSELAADPQSYFKAGDKVIANGRDPNFAAWTDTAQVNAFSSGLRKAVTSTLLDIASQCDGVRCDMAMLLTNQVFQRTWGTRGGQPLPAEYWVEIITGVRKQYPHMLFMAEVYWDMEFDLQQQGFNYCYDKRLYDRLIRENAATVMAHLSGDSGYQEKLVRFIENHDEPRASAVFPPPKVRAAALVCATLPGARMFYEGQFEGRKVKLPVQLGRRPSEPVDQKLQTFYHRLLAAISADTFHNGNWQPCQTTGWTDNHSHENLLAWSWRKDEDKYLVIINLSDHCVQGHVPVLWDDICDREFALKDVITGMSLKRSGYELHNCGLFVDLPPWNFYFLKFCPPAS
jgi:hypothetical protein